MSALFEIGFERTAVLDPTGAYRFLLTRVWDDALPRVCWVMLNPSVADAERDDNTISMCISYSRAWGFGSLEVANLFALVSTDPKGLKRVEDPVGVGNDDYIRAACSRASMIVCAWGAGGVLLGRGRVVMGICRQYGELFCLGVTRDGHPWHPLRKSSALKPVPFGVVSEAAVAVL